MEDIELVIKIPEKMYESVKTDMWCGSPTVGQAILKGTPLPKGHGRLIEVSKELECELWTYTRYTGIDEAPYENATKALESAPTIIEADKESDEEE